MTAEVRLWGKMIAAVTQEPDRPVAIFQYDPNFAQSGIEVSPLRMPLRSAPYQFPAIPYETFLGLPGLLADSIPDRFGNALIEAWLAREKRSLKDFTSVDRLCYVGTRGIGALEFAPAEGPNLANSVELEIGALVQLASEVLTNRESLTGSFNDSERLAALTNILRVGTSAGGARAKAVIAWNPSTNEVRSGQVVAGKGFEYWLLKFDGVKGNRDKELVDPIGFGAIEYAYSLMAKDAGIQMTDCRLFEENKRRHFMTKRFDRREDGDKIHMQSLCGLAHFDFNQAGAYSYEQAFGVIRELGLSSETHEEQFRRMVFNVVARNQDDHVKNIAFLMDKEGGWSLSPAFDVTYSYNPTGDWTAQHQMTLAGKRDGFTMDDFYECGKVTNMKKTRVKAIIEQVTEAVRNWRSFAAEAQVMAKYRTEIEKNHRLVFPSS